MLSTLFLVVVHVVFVAIATAAVIFAIAAARNATTQDAYNCDILASVFMSSIGK